MSHFEISRSFQTKNKHKIGGQLNSRDFKIFEKARNIDSMLKSHIFLISSQLSENKFLELEKCH